MLGNWLRPGGTPAPMRSGAGPSSTLFTKFSLGLKVMPLSQKDLTINSPYSCENEVTD